MGRLKKWIDELIGTDEFDDYENDTEPEEIPEAVKPPVFLHENARRPFPPAAVPAPLPIPKVPITIFEPTSFNDCKMLADKFKANEVIIINYNMITQTEARKIFYFMKGCIYALDGSSQRISENIYLYTPKSIGIQNPVNKAPSFEDTLRFSWKNQ